MHHHRIRIDLFNGVDRILDAASKLQHNSDVPAVSFKIGWPHAPLSAPYSINDRLVQRRIIPYQRFISLRKSLRIVRDGNRIFLIDKLFIEPLGTTIMHEVDDRYDTKFFD